MILLVASLFAACETTELTPCQELCQELVGTCDYAAYPDVTSCEQGCAYEEKRGADVDAHWDCVEAAECDTFQILQCENEFGAD